MRTKKIAISTMAELLPYIIIGILGIVKVKFLIMYLGDILNGYYQFINSAITYIFMAEAGFGSAVIFALYTHFANDDKESIKKVFAGAKKIFRFFGLLILGLTIIMTIAIPLFFISHAEFRLDVTLCFFIISAAYLLAFMGPSNSYYTVFCADQKKYIYSIIFNILKIISDVLIIVTLIYTGSLIALAIVILVVKVIEQIIIYIVGRRQYPYLSEKAEPDTSPFAMTKDLAWHQFGYLAANNIDSIILMLINGPFVVSIYTTYNFVLRFLREVAAKIDGVIVHAFGNVYVKENQERSYSLYKEYGSLCILISFVFSLTFLVGIRPFVAQWIGDAAYMLPYTVIILFSLNLFLSIIYLPLVSAINSNGLYKESKYYVFGGAVINLVLSILLVNIYGIAGVLLATSISSFFVIILRTKLISRRVFDHIKLSKLLNQYFIYAVIFMGFAFALKPIENMLLKLESLFYLIPLLGVIFIVLLILTIALMLLKDSSIKNTLIRIKSLIKTKELK